MLITRTPQFAIQLRLLGLGLLTASTAILVLIASIHAEEPPVQQSPARQSPAQPGKAKLVVKREHITQWVADLKDDDYEVRERAQRRLQKIGQAAIGPLLAGVESADPEVSWRCGEILQHLSIHGDDATIATLSAATAKAATSSQHSGLQAFASDLTQRRLERRHSIVRERLHALGAQVIEADGYSGDIDIGMALPDLMPAEMPDDEAIEEDVFGEDTDEEEMVETPPDDDIEAAAIPGDAIPADADPFGGDPIREEPLEDPEKEAAIDEPAIPPAGEELPEEPELAKMIEDAGDAELEPDEELELEGDAEGIDLEGVLKGFRGLEIEGIERITVEREVAKGADAIIARRIMGRFGGVAGVVDLEGNSAGQLYVDTSFRGRNQDLKDVKDLLGVGTVVLISPKLSDESLKYIAEMRQLVSLQLAAGSYTADGMRSFRKARPDVAFFARGSAVLGITGSTSGPCRLDEIKPDTGAAKAGLQQGDEIVEVDGKVIETFADLTVEVYPRKPGETLKIVYLRDGQRNEASILLKPRPAGQ